MVLFLNTYLGIEKREYSLRYVQNNYEISYIMTLKLNFFFVSLRISFTFMTLRYQRPSNSFKIIFIDKYLCT